MPANNFSSTDKNIVAPYNHAVTITPNDSADIAEVTRGLHVHAGTASTPVKVTLAGDTTAVTMNLQTGFIYPLRVSRVWATGTSATTVIGLY